VIPQYESEKALRIEFFGDEIEALAAIDPLRGKVLARPRRAMIYPASHYVAGEDRIARACQGGRQGLGGCRRRLIGVSAWVTICDSAPPGSGFGKAGPAAAAEAATSDERKPEYPAT